jgi:hypothetical protein
VISLTISGEYIMLEPLQARDVPGSRAASWCSAIRKAFGNDFAFDNVLVSVMVAKCISIHALRPFVSQLLWHLAQMAESVFGDALLQRKASKSSSSRGSSCSLMRFDFVKLEDLRGRDVDQEACAYLASCHREYKLDRVFFISTDKALVCRLPLQNTLICARDIVCLSPPNVSVGSVLTRASLVAAVLGGLVGPVQDRKLCGDVAAVQCPLCWSHDREMWALYRPAF